MTRITKGKRSVCYTRDHHRCVRCGSTEQLSIDHIIPLVKGGSYTDIRNMQTMCTTCNKGKGTKIICYVKHKKTLKMLHKTSFNIKFINSRPGEKYD
ncbi:MAG: HNH endonuclease [Planctomycetes bacterium]|nr:HNH endonuclease [Planctomycetota bacterium]